MDNRQTSISNPFRTRILLTGAILLAELAHLAWEHFHGGVVSHHILHRPDLPSISNWWGALLLPGLAWFLIGRIQKRAVSSSSQSRMVLGLPAAILIGFVVSLLFGAALAVAFSFGYEAVTSYMFLSMFLTALLFPIYRAECVLGFVLGMTFTFGAVLPTAVGSIFASISALVRWGIQQLLRLTVHSHGR
jgi:hypothetical protein